MLWGCIIIAYTGAVLWLSCCRGLDRVHWRGCDNPSLRTHTYRPPERKLERGTFIGIFKMIGDGQLPSMMLYMLCCRQYFCVISFNILFTKLLRGKTGLYKQLQLRIRIIMCRRLCASKKRHRADDGAKEGKKGKRTTCLR